MVTVNKKGQGREYPVHSVNKSALRGTESIT